MGITAHNTIRSGLAASSHGYHTPSSPACVCGGRWAEFIINNYSNRWTENLPPANSHSLSAIPSIINNFHLQFLDFALHSVGALEWSAWRVLIILIQWHSTSGRASAGLWQEINTGTLGHTATTGTSNTGHCSQSAPCCPLPRCRVGHHWDSTRVLQILVKFLTWPQPSDLCL